VTAALVHPAVPLAAFDSGRTQSYSRAEIVRAGRDPHSPTGSPWAFIPLALAALGAHPEDDEVRFLLALAYTRLGLKTSASEELQRLSAESKAEPGVASLHAVLGQLPADRVSMVDLARCLTTNLDVLANRRVEPVDLRSRVNAWKLVASVNEYFHARDGNLVWRGRDGGWKRWGDYIGDGRGFMPPHVANPQDYSGGVPGYVLEGLDPPFIFQRVYEQTPGTPEGYSPRITILQVDELEFLNGLATLDLTKELADERVRVYVGKERVQAWVNELEIAAARGLRIAAPSISLATLGTRVNPAPETIIRRIGLQQARRFQELSVDVARLYAPRTHNDIAMALAKPSGVRVLIPTCRYSTFIQHSAADLARAFESMGHVARVLIEPDAHSHLTSVAFLNEMESFKPDLVIQINYTRHNLGNLAPEGLAWVTWVQDAMPHLFDKNVGSRQGRTDFLAGNLRDTLFQFFEYPRSRAMAAPMVASEHKFHDATISQSQRERFACDLALVSHHSQTPELMHRAKVHEARATPWLVRAIEELFPRLHAVVHAPVRRRPIGEGPGLTGTLGPLMRTVENLCREVLEGVGAPTDEKAVTQLGALYAHPMLDRMLRHQTLEWAAELAQTNGWSLKLFGRGWENHPTLSPYAQGEIAHGEDLRACYQAARAHLHVSAHSIVHQRVFECALSGGVPLCRLQGDDLLTLQFQAVAQAVIAGVEPTCSEPYEVLEFGYGYVGFDVDAHTSLREFGDLLRDCGLPHQPWLWLNQVHHERLRRLKRFAGDDFPFAKLLGDPSHLLFIDRQMLEARARPCIEDDAHRSRLRESLLSFSRPWVTYTGFAKHILSFLSQSLVTEHAGERREWYDGRVRQPPPSRRSARPNQSLLRGGDNQSSIVGVNHRA
jgi:hypothetical protein